MKKLIALIAIIGLLSVGYLARASGGYEVGIWKKVGNIISPSVSTDTVNITNASLDTVSVGSVSITGEIVSPFDLKYAASSATSTSFTLSKSGRLSISTATSTNPYQLVLGNTGYIGIGVANPTTALQFANNTWLSGIDDDGSVLNGFKFASSSMIFGTDIAMGGGIDLGTNASGTIANLSITSDLAAGGKAVQSFMADNNPWLSFYVESDGAEGIQNRRIGIATTSPRSLLEVYNGYIKQDGIYGSVYFNDATSTQSIPTGATYTRINAFNSNGLSKNVTASSSEIILTVSGIYQVNVNTSGDAQTANVSFKQALFLDDTEQLQCHNERKYSTANDIGNSGITCIINVSSVPATIDLRTRHDNGGSVDYELIYGNINVNYIGEQ